MRGGDADLSARPREHRLGGADVRALAREFRRQAQGQLGRELSSASRNSGMSEAPGGRPA